MCGQNVLRVHVRYLFEWGFRIAQRHPNRAVLRGTISLQWRLKSCVTEEVTEYSEPFKIGPLPFSYGFLTPIEKVFFYLLPFSKGLKHLYDLS